MKSSKPVSVRLPNEIADYYRSVDLKGFLIMVFEMGLGIDEAANRIRNVTHNVTP